jgi:UDP-glucose 4-epimerase
VRSRRVLITGLATHWGGRLAQAIERDPAVEVVIGVDAEDPRVELERTEYVRVGTQHALLRRIVAAAEIDTVIDSRLVVDSTSVPASVAHENNVIGTMNILAACAGEDSPVRQVVFKSTAHWYGCEQDDPAFFTEAMRRPHPPRTGFERDVVEAESAVADFAVRNPSVAVAVLRFTNVLGAQVDTAHTRWLGLAGIPSILGFDPRYQFIHEDDVVGCLEHAVREDLAGIYNCAADGVLVLSEIADLLAKPLLPVLPPWGTSLATAALRRTGLAIPREMLNQMRFGRALDNRRLKATGYAYRYTTREAVIDLRRHQRLAPLLARTAQPFRYEREVEEFLRRSSTVRRPAVGAAEVQVEAAVAIAPPPAPTPNAQAYDDLAAGEVLALLDSLEPADLEALRRHEAAHQARAEVLEAISRLQARRPLL